MHARLLDVLHHGRDDRVRAVADRVDVDLDRVLDEAVDERVGRDRRRAHVVGRVADAHRAAAEHVGRPHEHGVADALGRHDRLVGVAAIAQSGARRPSSAEQVAEALAILGEVDRRRAGAEDRHAALDQPARELERRLAAELHDDADRLLALDDLEHVLGRERLEVQAVGRVVVGRDGLGIAVDHHRRVALRGDSCARPARSSSRTRCPARCGSGPSRGSARPGGRPRAARRCGRSSSRGTTSRPRPRRRRSRRS